MPRQGAKQRSIKFYIYYTQATTLKGNFTVTKLNFHKLGHVRRKTVWANAPERMAKVLYNTWEKYYYRWDSQQNTVMSEQCTEWHLKCPLFSDYDLMQKAEKLFHQTQSPLRNQERYL